MKPTRRPWHWLTQKYVEIAPLEGVESFVLFEFVGLDQATDGHVVEARLISPYRQFPCSFLCLRQPKNIEDINKQNLSKK